MERLNEIAADVKEIKAAIGEIKTNVAINTTSLNAHMQRTIINEARIANVEKWALGLLGSILVALVTMILTHLLK